MVQNKVTQATDLPLQMEMLKNNILTNVINLMFFILLEIRKVLVILTASYSSGGISVEEPAQQLKSSGVIIFSVGIGQNVSRSELRAMASRPVDQYIITLNNFTQLEGLPYKMFRLTCYGKCNVIKCGSGGDYYGF